MARRKAEAEDLLDVVLSWAKTNKVSHGPLAAMLTQAAGMLLEVDHRNDIPPVPTEGIVCRGHWWPHRPMKWRAMWLHNHEVIFEDEEPHGSRNISEYTALMETIKWIDEQGLEDQVPAVYSASYVAVRWIKERQFATSQRCPLWIEQAAGLFTTTDYPRHLVQYWNPDVWGGTPADYPGYDYLQKWDVR